MFEHLTPLAAQVNDPNRFEFHGPEVGPPGKRGFGVTMVEEVFVIEFGGTSEVIFPPQDL